MTLFAFVDTSPVTADQWVDKSIEIMEISTRLGAKIYPLIMAIGLIKAAIKYV